MPLITSSAWTRRRVFNPSAGKQPPLTAAPTTQSLSKHEYFLEGPGPEPTWQPEQSLPSSLRASSTYFSTFGPAGASQMVPRWYADLLSKAGRHSEAEVAHFRSLSARFRLGRGLRVKPACILHAGILMQRSFILLLSNPLQSFLGVSCHLH